VHDSICLHEGSTLSTLDLLVIEKACFAHSSGCQAIQPVDQLRSFHTMQRTASSAETKQHLAGVCNVVNSKQIQDRVKSDFGHLTRKQFTT
jgi:hypothetical protein